MSETIHAFKEWADICDLLQRGETSLLLRKGGIHEGREGFSFKHEDFLLFPTGFHQSGSGLKLEVQSSCDSSDRLHHPVEEGNEVTFRIFAKADFAQRITDKTIVDALAPHHVWAQDVVDQRYSYSEKLEADCLSVAMVRIYRLAEPWTIPYQRKFGGCRSWLDLENAPSALLDSATPVIADDEHNARVSAVKTLLEI